MDWLAGAQAGYGVLSDMAKMGWGIYSQYQTWNREDTAVQRRAADLKAAGLNPVLAAGSAAQTSAPVSFGAPRGDAFMEAMSVAKMRQDYSVSKSQEALIRAQTRRVNAEADVLSATSQDRIIQSHLSAQFDQLMWGNRLSKYAAEASQAQYASEKAFLEKRFMEDYGEHRAAAEALLAVVKAEVAQKTYLTEKELELVSLRLANEFMEKNVQWYVWNHTAGMALRGAEDIMRLAPESRRMLK